MNNRTLRFSLGAFAVGAIALLSQNAQSQTVLYNNTSTFTGDFNYVTSPTAGTAGNQVILSGGPNDIITSLSFQYTFSGSDTPTGSATADLIFYQNNGAQASGFTKGGASPSTILFSGTNVSLGTGSGAYTNGATITYSVANGGLPANFQVPQNFTWAVTFAGLTSSESAGLALFAPFTVGQNQGDAWYNTGNNSGAWALDVAPSGSPALDFGATISGTAVPEPSSLSLLAVGSFGLLASGWRKLRR